jgi:hypothetical protein
MMRRMDSGIAIVTYMGRKLTDAHRLRRTHLSVSIDGTKHQIPFGEALIPVASGTHEVSAHWAYSRGITASVVVPTNAVVKLKLTLPRFVWQRPSLKPVA